MIPLQIQSADTQDKLITIALGRTSGNRRMAAVLLGISLSNLNRRLRARKAKDAKCRLQTN
jgi:DNA-binding NtrC family response regulator